MNVTKSLAFAVIIMSALGVELALFNNWFDQTPLRPGESACLALIVLAWTFQALGYVGRGE